MWKYDRQMTAGIATGKSRPTKNVAMSKTMRRLYREEDHTRREFGGVRVEHVYSHLGNFGNERAGENQ